MFGDFMALPMDSLVNQAAKYWYVSNEQGSVPLVVRSAVGAGGRFGAIHSQTHGTWFQGIPGLKIVAPSIAGGRQGPAQGARSATTTPSSSSSTSGCTPLKGPERRRDEVAADSARPRSRARAPTSRSSRSSKGVRDALEAAEELAATASSAEVVDLRTLRPLDLETVLASVAKTNRLLAVEEGPRTGGWASGPARRWSPRQACSDLDDAWMRRDGRDADPVQPDARGRLPARRTATIVESVRARLGVSREAHV